MSRPRDLPRDGRQPEPADDPDLPAVLAAQADGAAFATLYRRYLDRVYGYAFYQLGDHHDAEDVTERIFLAALRALPDFRDQGSTFRAWLFRIAHNTIANAHRSRARRRTEPLPDDFQRAAPNADPAGQVALADELREIRRVVAEMPDDRRQVILLRFVDDLSTAEIAEVLDRSPGAVRVLLHRSLRDLAARLNARA
ncbi:MAG TPA: RNA polymerase sigma factor [Candidatus Limnocylindria bacterium]|nr:RNA polymerase sigma factor [Candidatus Limnocylindria bacterium]